MTPPPAADGSKIELPLRPAPSQAVATDATDSGVHPVAASEPQRSTDRSSENAKEIDVSRPHVTLAETDDGGEAEQPQVNKTAAKAASEVSVGDEGSVGELKTVKKRKKNKPKSKANRGSAAPNGFEEFYVDVPVTPEEFRVEQELYSTSIAFSDRIQIAIQKYSSKRKFDSTRRKLWVNYLQYGGIESGPKMFGGNDVAELAADDISAADKITLRATEYVATEIVVDETRAGTVEDHDPNFVVDFDGVMKAFLSLQLRSKFDLTTPDAVHLYCNTLLNWLKYLLHHNVCNDYRENVTAACKTLETAKVELVHLIDLPSLLPGTFGAACKSLFLQSEYTEFSWGDPADLDGFSKEDATRIFLASLAALGSEELCDVYSKQNKAGTLSVVEHLDTGLEITGIFPSTKQTRDMYAHPTQHGLTPLGYITAKTWWCPWAGYEDLTEEEEAALPAQQAAATHEYTFWMDDATIAKTHVGMKMMAEICKISFGVWFIRNIKLLYPSFAMWIPNEIMEGWRDHEYIQPKKSRSDVGVDGGEVEAQEIAQIEGVPAADEEPVAGEKHTGAEAEADFDPVDQHEADIAASRQAAEYRHAEPLADNGAPGSVVEDETT